MWSPMLATLCRTSQNRPQSVMIVKHKHTSCSSKGTFWSFMRWTPASAAPSSTAAAMTRLFFMICNHRILSRNEKMKMQEDGCCGMGG